VVPLFAEGKLDPNHLDQSLDGIRPQLGRKMEPHYEVLPDFQFLGEIEQQASFTGVPGPTRTEEFSGKAGPEIFEGQVHGKAGTSSPLKIHDTGLGLIFFLFFHYL
jgi:hypothetical protein